MIPTLVLLIAMLVPQIVPIGTSSISSNGTTTTTPLWAIRIGNTDTPETQNYNYCTVPALGSNCMNAVLWVHREGETGWRRVEYRRPENIDQFMEFSQDPDKFRTIEESTTLPAPFAGILTVEQETTIHFVIQYRGAGMKVYFNSGVSRDRVEDVLRAITAPRSVA